MDSEQSSSDKEEPRCQIGAKRLFSSEVSEMLFTPEWVCEVVVLRQSNRSSTDSEACCERDDVHKQNEKEISNKEASSSVSLLVEA